MVTRIVVVLVLLGTAQPLSAANFIVNSATSSSDAAPGDGVCEATAGAGDCSLTAAVEESNALSGTDTIALPAGTFVSTPLLFVTDRVIVSGSGPAQTTIVGSGSDTALHFDSVDVTLIGLTITGGRGINVGGGITNYSGHLTVIDSVVRDNNAVNVGGGIYNQGGRVTVIGSTIVNNHAGNVGGGVQNEGTMELVNSTVTGNQVLNTGGGIHNEGQLVIASSTITDNSCANTGAGIDNRSGGTVVMRNSIASGNWVYNFDPFGSPPTPVGYVDCIGTVDSDGYNLIENPFLCTLTGSGAGTDLIGVDPLLGPLAGNGGATPTRALQDGSPAINAGNPATPGAGGSACEATDQRGIDRPGGLRCDIGAFELSRCGNGIVDVEEECDDGSNVDGDGCDSNCTVTRCGNGVTGPGEECDDGNTLDGDCCSSSCQLPDPDDVVPAAPRGAKVELRAGAKGKLTFKWASAAPLAPESFGDPTTGTSLSLCVIDTSGATPRLLASASVPPGAGWSRSATTFSYVSTTTTPGRVRKIRLSGGSRGRISAQGVSPTMRPGRLPAVTPVHVQVVGSDAAARMGAAFDGALRNGLGGFKAKSR